METKISRPLVLVALESPTASFSIKPGQKERLQQNFPEMDFQFHSRSEEILPSLPQADYVITWNFQTDWYEKAPRLRTVLTPAAGKDWTPPDPSGRVPVLYGKFHGHAMSEYLIAMMLYHNLQLDTLKKNQERKKWQREDSRLLRDQKVVIIGYGNIGRLCAQRLRVFGCKVFGIKRTIPRAKDEWAERILPMQEVEDVLPAADHVVVILPSGPETDGIITPKLFAAMRGVFFCNMGRGNCYKEEDLVWALQQGHVRRAALDVFVPEPLPAASKLWTMPNVFITPHSSAVSVEYMDLFLDEMIPRLRNLHPTR